MGDRLPMTEDQLLDSVMDLCMTLGLRVHHCRPARTEKGWRTPIRGHAGFPDLVIAGPWRVVYRELKSATGKPSAEQSEWLGLLEAIGEDAGIWRPADWHDRIIERQLIALARGPAAGDLCTHPPGPQCRTDHEGPT